jgi:hypothetical protein
MIAAGVGSGGLRNVDQDAGWKVSIECSRLSAHRCRQPLYGADQGVQTEEEGDEGYVCAGPEGTDQRTL